METFEVYELFRNTLCNSPGKKLQKEFIDSPVIPVIKDIKGGLTAWAKSIDQDFPTY